MAIFASYTGEAVNTASFKLPELGNYTHYSFDQTLLRWYNNAGNGVSILGTDLAVAMTTPGVPSDVTGRIHSVMVQAGGEVKVLVALLDVSAHAAFAQILNQNWAGLRRLLTQGDDQFGGSVHDDTLLSGAGNDTIFASDGNDQLIAGAGEDVLISGPGADTLRGGAGADHFVFSADPASGADRIQDFTSATDVIDLSKLQLGLTGPVGTLAEDRFVLGTAASGAGQRVIYDQDRGLLYLDVDGAGESPQVLLARLGAGTVLQFDDIHII